MCHRQTVSSALSDARPARKCQPMASDDYVASVSSSADCVCAGDFCPRASVALEEQTVITSAQRWLLSTADTATQFFRHKSCGIDNYNISIDIAWLLSVLLKIITKQDIELLIEILALWLVCGIVSSAFASNTTRATGVRECGRTWLHSRRVEYNAPLQF